MKAEFKKIVKKNWNYNLDARKTLERMLDDFATKLLGEDAASKSDYVQKIKKLEEEIRELKAKKGSDEPSKLIDLGIEWVEPSKDDFIEVPLPDEDRPLMFPDLKPPTKPRGMNDE